MKIFVDDEYIKVPLNDNERPEEKKTIKTHLRKSRTTRMQTCWF